MNLNNFVDNLGQNEETTEAIFYWESKNTYTALTYADVKKFRGYVYNEFLEKNIEKNSCIALIMNCSIYIPSIILSCRNYGVAFVFLDPNEDWEINRSIIDKIGIKWVISVSCIHNIPLTKQSVIGDSLFLWKTNIVNVNVNYLNICYVISTSGTTGDPKIVKVEENCIFSNIQSLWRIFKITKEDVIFYGTSPTFDPSIVELFLSLFTGSKLVLVSPMLKLNPSYLINILFPKDRKPYTGITFLQTVPSLFLRWKSHIEFILKKSTLKILAFGGENFPCLPNWSDSLRVFNLYGITEVSCWASILEVKYGDEICLGNALDETILEVRKAGKVINEGVGELFIGSNTRICFLNNENSISKPVFRSTGDLVEITNNKLIYKGRTNRTIKRLGHKIDLNLIETQIFQFLNIENRCIYTDNKLTAFFSLPDCQPDKKQRIIDKIRVKLLHLMPKQHQPDYMDILPKFPLSKHGKVDENALKNYSIDLINQKCDEELSIVFKTLYCKYLGLNDNDYKAYRSYNFSELGGNSFTIIQLLNEFEAVTKCDKIRELTTLLFEKSCEECCDFLKTNASNLKRPQEDFLPHRNKIMKITNSFKLIIRWKYNLEGCIDSSPTIIANDGDFYVAVGSFSNIFVLLDRQSKEIFKLVLPGAIESPCLSYQNFIYIGCYDGKMYCISRKGEIVWKFQTGDSIKSTPCLCIDKTAIAFGSYDKYFYAINTATGLLVWKIYIGESIKSNAILVKDSLFVATIIGSCLRISENGTITWKYNIQTPIFTSPCLYEPKNYIIWCDVTGFVHFFDVNSGEKKQSFKTEGNIFSSPKIFNNNLLIGSGEFFYVLNIENSPEVQFNLHLNSAVNSTPEVFNVNNQNYVAVTTTNGNLFVIDFNLGSIESSICLPGDIFSSPVVFKDNIFVGCRDNNLYSIGVT